MILIANLIVDKATLRIRCKSCGDTTIYSSEAALKTLGPMTTVRAVQRAFVCRATVGAVRCRGAGEAWITVPETKKGL